jgi:hypothetical protein
MGNETQHIRQRSDPLTKDTLATWPEYDDLETALRADHDGELEQKLLAVLSARSALMEREINNVASSANQKRLIQMKEMLVAASTIIEAVSPRLKSTQ